MYYRRKIILSVLQILNKKVKHTFFQKFLFLFTEEQKEKCFDFVPYKFGCYSFQAESDIKTMVKYGLVESKDYYFKLSSEDYISQLKADDKKILLSVEKRFGKFTLPQIIKYVYANYPYYTLNSEIKDKYLSKSEIVKVKDSIEKANTEKLFTIGYEGISIEEYFNKLIKNNIKVLCDVRKNAISMKNGFSKNQLKGYSEKLGIIYFHFPELGIESNKRKNLNEQRDYDKLFDDYKKNVLPKNKISLLKIIEIIKEHNRVALTCFESYHTLCHRNKITESLIKLGDRNHSVTNL